MSRGTSYNKPVTGMERRSHKPPLLWLFILALTAGCETDPGTGSPSGLTGVYSCQESSPHSGIRNYLVEIDRVKDSDDLHIISNFHNQGENEFVYASLDGDTLRIVNQVLSGWSIYGKGPVASDLRTIYLYYETDDGITILDYYCTYTR